MEQAQSENKNQVWLKSHTWLFAEISAGVSLLLLLAPWLKVKTNDGKVFLYIWSFFGGSYLIPWGICAAIGLLVIGAILVCFHAKSPSFSTGGMFCFILAALFFLIGKDFFALSNPNAGSASMDVGLILASIFAAIAALFAFSSSSQSETFSVPEMVQCALLIAASIALNFLKLFSAGPDGGSVNLQMLPLFLIALRYGPSKSFLAAGIVFGLITCATDGYGFQCYPFDYLVGFGSVAVLGFFSRFFVPEGKAGYSLKGEIALFVGGVLATVFRCIGGTVSGVLLWGTPFVESLVYNAAYIFISGGIALGIIMGLYGPLAKLNQSYPVKKRVLDE